MTGRGPGAGPSGPPGGIIVRVSAAVLNRSATAPAYAEWEVAGPRTPARCWWRQRAGAGRKRVLPDGCADLIVTSAGRSFLVGPTMAPELVPLVGVQFRGLRLRTEDLGPALALPGGELRDLNEPLDAVFGTGVARELTEQVWRGDLPARFRRPSGAGTGGVISALLRGTSVADVVAGSGIAERTLRRTVLRRSGLLPSELGRLARFRRAVDLLDGEESLASIAQLAGYADQAHLTREFVRMAGVTPGGYRASYSRN